jgi:hypothetical protein
MSEAVKVNIERGTERRRIILSALCETVFPDLRGVDPKKFKEIEDWEVENVLNTITAEEKQWVGRKYFAAFRRNVDAALLRLHPPASVRVHRVATGILEKLQPHEIGNSAAPINPDNGKK